MEPRLASQFLRCERQIVALAILFDGTCRNRALQFTPDTGPFLALFWQNLAVVAPFGADPGMRGRKPLGGGACDFRLQAVEDLTEAGPSPEALEHPTRPFAAAMDGEVLCEEERAQQKLAAM